MLYEVIPTKIFRSGADFLTYSSDSPLEKGTIVKIPLGKSECVGIVKGPHSGKTAFKVKKIINRIEETPLPPYLLKSLLWLSSYYLLPLPSVASLFLPVGVEKSRRTPKCCKNYNISSLDDLRSLKIPLNPAQTTTLSSLETTKTPTKLLHGITGSGKTNIYLELSRKTLLEGKSVILLVPEIALTSQLVQIFERTFSRRVVLIHSKKTESERHQIWKHLLSSDSPEIIIGPRSALFSPLKNLGLIIIDESHESAYYQENSPRYSALRLASFIAKTLDITCLQGTATPLVSDYYLAEKASSLVPLEVKAKSTAIPPKITIIDLKNHENFKKSRYFSDQLLASIRENLKSGHQSLIYHNRRGSAPLTICENCGWQSLCPHCFLPLTLHSDSYTLNCHLCGYSTAIPHSCPECHSIDILHKGFGTKLLESELKKLFPSARIARFDADNKKSETLDVLYGDLKSGHIDIIIGTQTIARGLDLEHLATVGVVQADSGLSLPDFAAEEKTFHLLTQVIGRVGRGHLSSTSVFIQTFQPDHPAIRFATTADYASFSSYLLKMRQKQHFPPYYFLARLTVTAKTEPTVLKKIRAAHSFLSSLPPFPSPLFVSPPTPVIHERSTAGYTWELILKSHSRTTLVSALSSLKAEKSFSSSNFHITLDPPSLL